MDEEIEKPSRPVVKAPTPPTPKPPKDAEPEPEVEEEEESKVRALVSGIPLPKVSYMMIGFLLIAGISGWMNLQQARTVDSIGDIKALQAEKFDLNIQLSDKNEEKRKLQTSGKNLKGASGINEEIKDLNKKVAELNKELSEQELDVKENSASMLNGAWFWTLLIQLGSACFGIGIINILMNKKEDARIRSAAIFVIGGLTIFLLLTRILSLIAVKM